MMGHGHIWGWIAAIGLFSGGAGAISSPVPASPLSLLSESDLDQALSVLGSLAIPTKETPTDDSRRVALGELLKRLGPGSGIFSVPPGPQAAEKESAFPFVQELLPAGVGFIRPGKITPESLPQWRQSLRDFAQMGVTSLILDLRASNGGGSVAVAAELSSLFVPENTPLFSVRDLESNQQRSLLSKEAKPYAFSLLVLTTSQTGGAAEIVGAALRIHADALVIGSQTKGQAAEYAERPLSEGNFLRFPKAYAVFEALPDLFPKGLTPDLAIAVPESRTAEILRVSSQGGKIADFLSQPERPRLNEAALVAGKNPETEQWIRDKLARSIPQRPSIPRDAVLERAMDFAAAQRALNSPTPVSP
ncbi:MAG: hypothetical protein RLZZ399_72 [Verrucomicrobiota bacterium]|jgi:hypothetical protein